MVCPESGLALQIENQYSICKVIARIVQPQLLQRLTIEPAAALLGPRQAGKTTLARSLATHYFDLEQSGDQTRLDAQWDEIMASSKLVAFDEAQAWPALFSRLRGAIDADRSRNGRFLLLGSVTPGLLKEVSESLAGRIALLELGPLLATEASAIPLRELWLRGGLPPVALVPARFPAWPRDYVRNLVQRDLPQWGWTATPQLTERLLRMLALVHGQSWNASQIASSLGLTHPTINRYLDFLEGVFLVRRLPPWSANLRKRWVKSPKVYWRDSGLLHAMLDVDSTDDLLSQPWVGASWEGFVIEQVVGTLQAHGVECRPHYLRTSDGYEIDLIVEIRRKRWAIEVKLTSDPAPQDVARLDKAADLIEADYRVLVSNTSKSAMGPRNLICNLPDLMERILKEV